MPLQSASKKYNCSICGFECNKKSVFSEHFAFPVHRDAAMKKLLESVS